MDEFPTDLYETVAVMWEVLQAGSIGPHGGLNFDAKPRRTSFYEEDLFRSHIAGMDAYAAGLLVADKMNQDGFIQNLQAERYSSYDSGIGKDIDEGNVTLADLEATARQAAVRAHRRHQVRSPRVRQGHHQQLHH